MRRGTKLFALPGVVLAFLVLFGCEQTPEVDEVAVKAAEDWAGLQQAKSDIDGKRQELTDLRQRIANPGDNEPGEGGDNEPGEGEEGAEPPPSPEELAAQAEAMQQDIYKLADDFGPNLTMFINDQIKNSDTDEPTEMLRLALRMKSDEDIELAKDYIEQGGDYQRAIDIYNQTLKADPDYEALHAAKASAEELRYMTEERLGEIKKGMTEAEVRGLLGTPKVQNVREFENDGITGWFFPKKDPPNSAAGVFFKDKKGVLKVYKTDFDAVKAPSADS